MKDIQKKQINTKEQMMEAFNEAIDHYINKNRGDYKSSDSAVKVKQSITSYFNKHFEMGEKE